MIARQRVGGHDAACVWDCTTWESVHILQCSHKYAAGAQGLFFFFNCMENFMLFFWVLAMNTQMHWVLERTQGLLQHKDLSSCVFQISLNALSWRFKESAQVDDLAVKLLWCLSLQCFSLFFTVLLFWDRISFCSISRVAWNSLCRQSWPQTTVIYLPQHPKCWITGSSQTHLVDFHSNILTKKLNT